MRSWFVIPAMGVACGGAAAALGLSPAFALTGAAIAAVVRMLAGDSPAALTGAVLAPLLAVASLASFGDAGPAASGDLARAAVALAAACWTVTELARPGVDAAPVATANDNAPEARAGAAASAMPFSPYVALLPACVAAILDPSFAALIAIAGARLVTHPGRRPRWVLAAPVAGAFVVVLAVLAGTTWHALGARWFAGAAQPVALLVAAARAGATLGPLTAVAALAGLVALARARYAELALAAAIAGALVVDLRAGTLGAASIGLAALLAGLAIGRLAALIRIPSGQALTGATVGLLVILPPSWIALDARLTPAPHGHPSRQSP